MRVYILIDSTWDCLDFFALDDPYLQKYQQIFSSKCMILRAMWVHMLVAREVYLIQGFFLLVIIT